MQNMTLNPENVLKTFQQTIQLKPLLDNLEVSVLSCVLNKAIEKLLILKELLQGSEKHESLEYTSPAVRMKERVKFVPPEARVPDDILFSQHLKWHTSFLLNLFDETLTELQFQGSQVYLEYTLCCENLKVFDNEMIKKENEDGNKQINYLQEKIKNYKQNNQNNQQFLLESTGPCLDKAVVNVYAEENLGTLYGCIREETRTEKNILELKENERAVQQLNEKLNYETEEETLIHQEVHSHLALLTAELTDKTEYWTNKYNTEINQLDLDLLQMKSLKEEQTKALETLLQQFSEKKEIMEALQAEYEAREKESKKKLIENRAAEKIQRWWRNVLFKKALLTKYRKKTSKNTAKKQTIKNKTKK